MNYHAQHVIDWAAYTLAGQRYMRVLLWHARRQGFKLPPRGKVFLLATTRQQA